MSNTRIATRYAKSLLDLAVERGEVEAVQADMQLLAQAVQNRDLYLLLKSPIVSAQKKLSVLRAVFDGKVGTLTLNYLQLLVGKKREAFLPEIIREFIHQYNGLKGITEVQVVSAAPLSEETLLIIRQKIAASGLATKDLDITTRVDPALIGGFIVTFDDKRYDASIASRLAELKADFSKNQYVREF